MKIYFVTGNKLKVSIAADILKNYGIEVAQKNIDIPEIQAQDGREICEFSAKYAAEKLKVSVVKTDVSYSIPALNGFPGPFIKFVNKWLNAEDMLRLMAVKNDRSIEIKEYLSFADKKQKVTTFTTSCEGKIATKVMSQSGSTFDQLIIREGFKVPQNLLTEQELQKMFHNQVKVWHEFGRFMQGKMK